MWTVSGPFDGETVNETSFQKTKLLKTGTKYQIGRKDDCPLLINHKKVSKLNGELTVGSYTLDDVFEPSAVSKLEFCNTKDKVILVSRGSSVLSVNPSVTQELRDGDVITLAGGVGITVNWVRVSCYSPIIRGQESASLQVCESLGISVTSSSSPENTHHLVSSYAVNPSVAASLISATQLVRPEWLHEIVRLGALPSNVDGSLEKTFILPPIAKFRPTFPPTLPTAMKVVNVWEPNEERLNIFRGYVFLSMGDKGREIDPELKKVIERGQGSCEGILMQWGRLKWHQALSKGKKKVSSMQGGKGLVLVGDAKLIKARLGNAAWYEFIEENKSFGLHLLPTERVLLAVIHIDVSYIDSSVPVEDDDDNTNNTSPLSSLVPNTHADEPTNPSFGDEDPQSVPKRNLTRGALSTDVLQPEVEQPLDPIDVIVPPPPRRPLARRAKGKGVIVGIEDTSANMEGAPESTPHPRSSPAPESASAAFDYNAPIPMRSSRLKRRVGQASPSVSAPDPVVPIRSNNEVEPPLKKFRALFESSNPDKFSQDIATSMENYGSASSARPTQQSVTQSDGRTQFGHLFSGVGALEAVAEEEEEQSEATQDIHLMKRKADKFETSTLSSGSKRAAIENVNAVVPQSTTTSVRNHVEPVSKSGAPSGKPDIDAAFLKAVASTKRGKRAEDDFDREFNQLKISKPDLQHQREEDWAVLADFGDDANIRGNFMVVLEMDVHRRERGTMERTLASNPEWQNRPNFKKFKKKCPRTERAKIVTLVASQENDYGVGTAYWKGSKSRSKPQSQSQNQSQVNKVPPRALPSTAAKSQTHSRKGTWKSLDSDEEEVVKQVAPSYPTTSEPHLSAPTSEPVEKAEPLFLPDDEENKIPEKPQHQETYGRSEDGTLESSAGTRTQPRKTTRTAKAKPVINDDSDDDGATLKGFLGRTTRSRRR